MLIKKPCIAGLFTYRTYGILRMHSYMNVVGRATQDAKAEEQFEGYIQGR